MVAGGGFNAAAARFVQCTSSRCSVRSAGSVGERGSASQQQRRRRRRRRRRQCCFRTCARPVRAPPGSQPTPPGPFLLGVQVAAGAPPPGLRREAVSCEGLAAALADASVGHIVLAAGRYNCSEASFPPHTALLVDREVLVEGHGREQGLHRCEWRLLGGHSCKCLVGAADGCGFERCVCVCVCGVCVCVCGGGGGGRRRRRRRGRLRACVHRAISVTVVNAGGGAGAGLTLRRMLAATSCPVPGSSA